MTRRHRPSVTCRGGGVHQHHSGRIKTIQFQHFQSVTQQVVTARPPISYRLSILSIYLINSFSLSLLYYIDRNYRDQIGLAHSLSPLSACCQPFTFGASFFTSNPLFSVFPLELKWWVCMCLLFKDNHDYEAEYMWRPTYCERYRETTIWWGEEEAFNGRLTFLIFTFLVLLYDMTEYL